MPYILTKTDGTTLTTVQDASVDNTTSLTFVGRNYAGYGQSIEENFIKLLENFSSTTKPSKPIQGQLWFDKTSTSQRLKICYDGTNFREVANIAVGNEPTSPSNGDLWWNTITSQLNVRVSGTWEVSSPFGGKATSWNFDRIPSNLGDQNAIKGLSGQNAMVVFSNYPTAYYPTTSTIFGVNTFTVVKPGITLPGADPITGVTAVSTTSGFLLWGTSADSLRSQNVKAAKNNSNASFYVPFLSTTTGYSQLQTTDNFYFNPSTNVLHATASSSIYADLAERYEADAVYDEGTVVVIGGEKEITVTSTFADTRVAGIVSKNPAYMMNSEAGTDETHPFIALKGRVPCKVLGPITKGDLLVTSGTLGHAQAWSIPHAPVGAVIAKALESYSEGLGIIEVLVV
jgi:hypothetical protein